MKVLHVFNELRFSGAEYLLHSGADEFLQTGEHTVLSTGSDIGEFGGELAMKGYGIKHLPFRKSPKYFLSFFRLLLTQEYDLVHLHAERSALWNAVTVRASGRPCVRTVHNEFLFEGALRLKRAWGRKISASIGVAHVSCSQRVARNEIARFGVQTQVIDNWIDPSRVYRVTTARREMARQNLSICGDAFVIVSIGNYGPAKNQKAIVDAVRLCAPNLNILYLHCGAGAELLMPLIDNTLDPHIRLMGAVRNIADILAAADAFVSTSFFEGGQISLLEAAAAGVPCITTRVGLAEVFDGCAGVGFIEPSAESLASAIRQLARTDPQQRLDRGAMLSDMVLQRFVPKIGARNYVALYRLLLRKKVPSAGESLRL